MFCLDELLSSVLFRCVYWLQDMRERQQKSLYLDLDMGKKSQLYIF